VEEGRGEQEGAGSEVEGGHQNGYTDAVSAERGDASLDADEDADGGALRGLSVHTDVAGSGEGVDASPPKQRTDPVDDDSSVATTPGHTEPRQAPEDIVPEKSPESGTPRERDGESRSMRSLKAFTKSAPPRGDGLSTEDVQMALFHVEQLFSSSAQELGTSSKSVSREEESEPIIPRSPMKKSGTISSMSTTASAKSRGDTDDTQSVRRLKPALSMTSVEGSGHDGHVQRRGRLESNSRPAAFLKGDKAKRTMFEAAAKRLAKLTDEKAKATDKAKKDQAIDALDMSIFQQHGVQCPALRERLHSRAISSTSVEHLMTDFAAHDLLSPTDLEDLEAVATEAQRLHRMNKIAPAQALYNRVLQKDPVHFECLANLGKIYYGAGEYEKAKDLFERAIVIRPEREKTMYYLAQVVLNLADWEQSKLLFEQVVSGFKGQIIGESCDKPTYLNAIAMLGLIHQMHFSDNVRAASLYDAVLAEEPENLLALDHRAALLAMTGEAVKAANLHLMVMKLDPNHLTGRVCPYLNCLFPADSDMMHPFKELDDRDTTMPLMPFTAPTHQRSHGSCSSMMQITRRKVGQLCGASAEHSLTESKHSV